MAKKFKIDYKNDAFVVKHNGYELSHPVFSVFLKQLKETFGREYGGYKTTYNAGQALKNKDHSR